MTISIGVILQAFGVLLEGFGLLIAFGAFGTIDQRWLRAWRNQSFIPSGDDLQDEGFLFSIQIIFIGLGLLLQFIGLFVEGCARS